MSNTKDNSPNGLKPSPQVKTVSKKVMYGILIALFLVFSVLYYSINVSTKKNAEELSQNLADIQEPDKARKDFLLIEGSGLAIEDKEKEEIGIIIPETPKEEKALEPIIIVRGKPQENVLSQEMQEIKRLRTQNYLSALQAPIISKQYTHENNQVQNVSYNPNMLNLQENSQINPLATAMSLQQGGYDPSADKDKEDFFNRSQFSDKAWISSDIRTRGQDFEIKTGSVLPAIMVTGINSELPGILIAQVSQDVYDTASGLDLLIPQGSRLYGVYDSRVVYGQERVLVAWNRIIFPDGSAITLPAMAGADLSGNAGLHDQVNNHYFKTFGSAILMSLITAGTSYALDMSGAISDENSLQSQLTASLAQQIGETSANLLEKNLTIKPTLEIRSGYQFNVVLTKDLVFEEAYRAWR